jgi:hypothetical protein
MRKKIPHNDINYIKYQADQLENTVKQRSHQRRALIRFIKANRSHLRWWDNYISTRCDTTLVEKARSVIASMEEKSKTPS